MDKLTIILRDSPDQSEQADHALRYASRLLAQRVSVHLFLLGDGVLAAKAKAGIPARGYNAAEMLSALIAQGAQVKTCAACCAARKLDRKELLRGVRMGHVADLARWSRESDSVLRF